MLQTRQECFYSLGRIPDTFEGRFEMMCLHFFFVMEGLSFKSDDFLLSVASELSNEIFTNLEVGLREKSIGDFGIGPKMNALSKNFWGRMRAYEKAAEMGDFKDALWKNLFSRTGHRKDLEKMDRYCRVQAGRARSLSKQQIMQSQDLFEGFDE